MSTKPEKLLEGLRKSMQTQDRRGLAWRLRVVMLLEQMHARIEKLEHNAARLQKEE